MSPLPRPSIQPNKPPQQKQHHVVVIGAGVIGLTNALFLAEAGYRVTIIAAHVPGDSSVEYTSPWAGAHWLPHARAHEPEICDWDVQTYEYWLELMRREEEELEEKGRLEIPYSGLKQTDSYEFWDEPPSHDLWYAPHVEAFRQLSPSQPPISKINARTAPCPGTSTTTAAPQISHGAYYKAMSINAPQYLLHLLVRTQAHGVRLMKARLETTKGFAHALEQAEELARSSRSPKEPTNLPAQRPTLFINSTGLGARPLCGPSDPSPPFPIRGQTVLVKGEARSTLTRVGANYRAYCIPRPGSGTTILGGTREEGIWDCKPDEGVTREILERGRVLVPELLTGGDGGFEVLGVQCGLRPGREGGVRVEGEVVFGGGDDDGTGMRVVHCYGHAGAGYQNSVGSARKVVGLVGEMLAEAATVVQAKL